MMIPKSFSELLLFQDVVFHPVSITMSERDWFTGVGFAYRCDLSSFFYHSTIVTFIKPSVCLLFTLDN